jgi:hypothetical protein
METKSVLERGSERWISNTVKRWFAACHRKSERLACVAESGENRVRADDVRVLLVVLVVSW